MRERAIPTVMGNYDQGIGFETGDCGCVYKTDEQRAEGAASLAWTEQATLPDTRAYLRTLEDRFVLETPAGELLAVHGSPRRINEYLFEDRPENGHGAAGRGEPVSGDHLRPHAHPLHPRGRQARAFVNVGSGGRPKDGDWRVCYALIEPEAAGAGDLAVKFVRVEYDHASLTAALAKTDLITTFQAPPAAAGAATDPTPTETRA